MFMKFGAENVVLFWWKYFFHAFFFSLLLYLLFYLFLSLWNVMEIFLDFGNLIRSLLLKSR
jgi:hypothetical protein